MKSLAFLILLITCCNSLNAQHEAERNISFSYGPSYLARQDLIFSPFVHRDFSLLKAGLSFESEGRSYHRIDLAYSGFAPMLGDSYEYTQQGETKTAGPGSFSFVELDYLIGKKLLKNDRWKLTSGGAFLGEVQSLNYAYAQIGHFGYFASFGLGVFGKLDYELSQKQHLTARLELPIASWIARSPYAINDDEFIENTASHSGFKTFWAFLEDGDLTSWHELQSFDLDLSYWHDLNQRWKLGGTYQFAFIHAPEPRNLLSYQHSVQLNICFQL